MAPRRLIPRARSAGFTLLEVVIAATIFAIAAGALVMTFSIGIRAWRASETGSEALQTARIAQEVILRDLHNLAYLSEPEYNTAFRRGLEQFWRALETERRRQEDAARPERRRDAPGNEADPLDPHAELGRVPQPIDLTFQGQDGGLTDTLSFARHQRPRSTDEAEGLGIIGVRYYVKDGVLYREQRRPYGFRPGLQVQTHFERRPGGRRIARLFYGAAGAETEEEDEGPAWTVAEARAAAEMDAFLDELLPWAEGQSMLLDDAAQAEPLCEGVEIFNVTYGYYRFDQWNEVNEWDSNAYRYRFPLDEELAQPQAPGMTGAIPPEALLPDPRTATEEFIPGLIRAGMAVIGGQRIRYTKEPDGLPGYIALQLGVRDPDQGGRLRSFTFFVSLPLAREELDTSLLDPEEQAAGARVDPLNPVYIPGRDDIPRRPR